MAIFTGIKLRYRAAVSRVSARQEEAVVPVALQDDGFGPMDAAAAPAGVATLSLSDEPFSVAWPTKKPVVIVNLTSITVQGNVASGKVGQVFPATFASGNATISNVNGTGTAAENKITLHFTVKSKGARVTVGMAFENVTSAKQIRLTQLNVTYLDLAKNSSALSGAASAVAKKLNDTTTGLDLAAASDKSYLCDAALTYALKSDKSQPLTLTSVALFDVQAQAFVRTGKMATDDASSVCPGSASGNTTGVYIGAGIAACALLFLVVFSCSNCSGNEESYRKLESHA